MLALLCSLVAPWLAAGVGLAPLEELVRVSDAIVVGRVRELREIAVRPDEHETPRPCVGSPECWLDRARRVRVAELELERVLKGDPTLTALAFLAEPTWTCDVSTAIAGERVLCFLVETRWIERRAPDVQAELARALDGEELLELAWSGHGRLPIRGPASREEAWSRGHLLLPDDLEAPRDERTARPAAGPTLLEPLLERVGSLVREQALPILRARARDATGELELELWGDGRLALRTRDARGRKRVEALRVSSEPWSELLARVRLAASPSLRGAALGDEHGRAQDGRELWLRVGELELELAIGALESAWTRTSSEWLLHESAFRLWALVRELVDRPGFVDHRERDRVWLETRWPYSRLLGPPR